ncbi:hypothetical protein [Methylophilus sp.]
MKNKKGVLMAVLAQYHQDAFVLEIHSSAATGSHTSAIIAVDNGTCFRGA